MTWADRAVQEQAIPSAKELMDKAKAFVQVQHLICREFAMHVACAASDTVSISASSFVRAQ